MDHPREEAPTVYEFSEAKHMEQMTHTITILH